MSDLLRCKCGNLASNICLSQSCIKCCNVSKCTRHYTKNTQIKRQKNKQNKTNKHKVNVCDIKNSDSEKIFDEDELYTQKRLDKLKKILIEIKKLNIDVINYVVDNFIDDRYTCKICNKKRNEDELYPCYYCKQMVCDDTCNEVTNGDYRGLKYYCLKCKDDGIVSESENEDEYNEYNYNDNYNYYSSDSSDDISLLSSSSDIEIEPIDIEELAHSDNKCDCGSKAKYLIRQIDKIPRCWSCKNILTIDNNPHSYFVCKLDCESSIFIDSIKKINDKIIIESCNDKDECDHCGRRNISCRFFESIKFINTPNDYDAEKCKCGNYVKYKLVNKNTIKCINCENILFENYEHNICSTMCTFNHGWKINEYLSKKKNTYVKFEFINEKYKCDKCDYIQDIKDKFVGDKIKIEKTFWNY